MRAQDTRRLTLGDIKVSDLFLLVGFTVLFFESYFQMSVSSVFSYIDEACAIGLFFLVLRRVAGKRDAGKIAFPVKGVVVTCTFLLIVGLLGTLVSRIQVALYPVVIDVFTSGKGLFTLAAVIYLAEFYGEGKESFVELVVAECKILTVALLFGAIVNLFVDAGLSGEGHARYGLRPYAFIFYHPTIVVYLVTGLAAILISHSKNPVRWSVRLCFVLICTLRSKGFGEAAVIFLLMFLIGMRGRGARLRWWHVLSAGFALLVVGWSQLEYYYFSDASTDQARTILTRTAIDLANGHFPLGTGFATFGAAVTSGVEYYSPVYYQYGFDNVWGLNMQQSGFITDSFWPTVIGQFGYLGLFFVALSIFFLCRTSYRYARCMGPRVVTSVLVILVYLLLSSTSESAFFAPQCVYLAVCMGISLLKFPSKAEPAQASMGFAAGASLHGGPGRPVEGANIKVESGGVRYR